MNTSLINTLQTLKVQAMKDKDKVFVTVLNDLLSKLQNVKIELKRDLTVVEEFQVITRVKNQLSDELESLHKAGRNTDDVKRQFVYASELFDEYLAYQPKVKSIEEVKQDLETYIESGLVTMKDLMNKFKETSEVYNMKEVSMLVKDRVNSLK